MKRLTIILITLLTLQRVYSQDESSTVFTYNINDDLYLSLDGSWKFQVDSLYNGEISDLIYNTTFSQIPDFSATLWLFNMFFFETEIKEDSDDNVFILGYQNSDTLIKEIRVGNDDLNIGRYADYTPSYNTDKAPGLRTKISNETSTHEILVRYTSEITDSVSYRGYNSLTIDEIYISEYEKDLFFQLPSSYTMDSPLYTKTEDGVILIDDNNYIIDSNSIIKLLSDSYTNILVDSSDLTPQELSYYSSYIIEDGGNSYIYLYQRGNYTPFTCQNVYNTSLTGDEISIIVNDDRYINFDFEDEYIIFKDKFPFIALEPNLYLEESFYSDYFTVIQVEISEAVDIITVPENAKENSLSVYINDKREYDFDHDTTTGEVKFNRVISPLDEVLINYDIESDPGTANLLTTYGSSFLINEYLTFDMSHTLDWNISDDDYTYTEFENSGSIHSKGKLNLNYNDLQAEITSSINSFIPDTKGVFLLSDFDTTTTILPISSIDIENNLTSYTPLIQRDHNDELMDVDEFNNLEIIDENGAYTITLSHYNSSSSVIVMETGELETGENSAFKLLLDSYADDYSWVQNFSISTLSDVDRSLNIYFINSVTGETLLKNLTITSSDNFNTSSIDIDDNDLDKLGYIDEILIVSDSVSSEVIFIKDLSFEGVKEIKKLPTGERLISIDDYLYIPGESSNTLEVELPVSSIGLESYKTLQFSLIDENFFTESSEFYIELYSRDSLIESMTITDLESEDFSIELPNSGYLDRIILKMTNTGTGTLKLSPLTLKDPVTSLNSLHTISMTYEPELTWNIGDFTIIDSLKLKVDNELDISTTTENTLYSNISLNLFGVGLSTEINHYDEEVGFGYGVTLPASESPITLKEYYYYRDYRYREDSMEVTLSNFSSTLTAKDQIKETNRETENSIEISISSPILSLESETAVEQKREGSIKDLSTDIFESYANLFITNSDFDTSKSSQILTLSLDTTVIDMETTVDMGIDAGETTSNSYGLEGKLPVTIGNFSISPGYEILYKLTKLESQTTLTDQIQDWYSNITINHPINISIIDLFWGSEYSSFFEDTSDNRTITSSLSLELSHTFETGPVLEMLVPSTISISTTKNLTRDGSLTTATMDFDISADFTLSSTLVNKFQLTLTEDLESGDITPDSTLETSLSLDIRDKNRLIFLHTLNYNSDEIKSGTEVDYNWEGKNGPVYIVPLVGWILDAPYSFDHEEKLHITFNDDFSTFKTGFRHETVLSVLHNSEIEMFFDLSYDLSSDDRLYMEAGIYMTLIF